MEKSNKKVFEKNEKNLEKNGDDNNNKEINKLISDIWNNNDIYEKEKNDNNFIFSEKKIKNDFSNDNELYNTEKKLKTDNNNIIEVNLNLKKQKSEIIEENLIFPKKEENEKIKKIKIKELEEKEEEKENVINSFKEEEIQELENISIPENPENSNIIEKKKNLENLLKIKNSKSEKLTEEEKIFLKRSYNENIIIEDEPLNSTFLFKSLPITFEKKDSITYKIEALRIYMEKELTLKRLLFLYNKIRDLEIFNDLNPKEEKFLPFINQLIFLEDKAFIN